ncbi:potassium transporter, partial [Wenyingzhuangia sp. 1_MG-2023]|nr:potassium transporter [Wenyingzhuangia sp. 1_MG-2023]
MHISVIARVLGIFLMLFSLTMLPPILVSLWFNDDALPAFISALAITFGLGFLCWLPVRHEHHDLRTRDGFVITVLFWIVLALSGSFPFM